MWVTVRSANSFVCLCCQFTTTPAPSTLQNIVPAWSRFQVLVLEAPSIVLFFLSFRPLELPHSFRGAGYVAVEAPAPAGTRSFVSGLIRYKGERMAHPLWKPGPSVWDHFIGTREERRHRHLKQTGSVAVPSSCARTFSRGGPHQSEEVPSETPLHWRPLNLRRVYLVSL